MNNIVWIIMDSCRYDSWFAPDGNGLLSNCSRLGTIEKRTAWSSWTPAAHLSYLHGMMPFDCSPQWAPDVSRRELNENWSRRCGVPFDMKTMSPHMCLPKALTGMGYECIAITSLPLLGRETVFAAEGFYRFTEIRPPSPSELAFNDELVALIGNCLSVPDSPTFWFINLAETHYPYMMRDLPIIHGHHGVAKRGTDLPGVTLNGEQLGHEDYRIGRGGTFTVGERNAMRRMHEGQRAAAARLDEQIGKLFDLCPPNTWFIVTADHGECFGEGGYFGHGPVWHPKVYEVPFVEGLNPGGGVHPRTPTEKE